MRGGAGIGSEPGRRRGADRSVRGGRARAGRRPRVRTHARVGALILAVQTAARAGVRSLAEG